MEKVMKKLLYLMVLLSCITLNYPAFASHKVLESEYNNGRNHIGSKRNRTQTNGVVEPKRKKRKITKDYYQENVHTPFKMVVINGSELENLQKKTYSDVGVILIDGVGDNLYKLRWFPYLKSLDVSSVRDLKTKDLHTIFTLETLWEINFSTRRIITDSTLSLLAKGLKNIKRLNLSKTYVFGSGLIHFCKMQKLEFVDLSGTHVCGEHLECLRKKTITLNLDHTFVTKEEMEQFK